MSSYISKAGCTQDSEIKIHQSLEFNESSHCGYQNIKSLTKDRRNPPLDGAAEADIDSKDVFLINNVVDSGLYKYHFDLLLDGGELRLASGVKCDI